MSHSIDSTAIKNLCQAIATLEKASPDGATLRNRVGWNGNHSNDPVIRDVVDCIRNQKLPTRRQAVYVLSKLYTYINTQLVGLTLPTVQELNSFYNALEDAAKLGRVSRDQHGNLAVTFGYDEKWISVVKSIPDTKPVYKAGAFLYWSVKRDYADILNTWLPKLDWSDAGVTPKTLTDAQCRQILRMNTAWVEGTQLCVRVVPDASSPLDGTELRSLMFGNDWQWDKKTKTWLADFDIWRVHFITSELPWVVTEDSLSDAVRDSQSYWVKRQTTIDNILSNLDTLIDTTQLDGRTNRAHQVKAIQMAFDSFRHYYGAYPALDMGLGKTRVSLLIAKAIKHYDPDLAVVVIAPRSVVTKWYAEARGVGVDIQVFSWAKVPDKLELDNLNYKRIILIVDEAHYMKSPEAQRTRNLLDIRKYAQWRLLLSGSPFPNGRSVEAFTQLHFLDHPVARVSRSYLSRFGGNTRRELETLRQETSDIIFYMHKSECTDLPPLERVIYEVDISPAYKDIYETKLNDFMTRYHGRVNEGICSGNAEMLVYAQGLRLSTELGKVESAAQLVLDIMAQGEPVVVFCEFKETASALKAYLTHSKPELIPDIDDTTVEAQKAYLEYCYRLDKNKKDGNNKVDPSRVALYSQSAKADIWMDFQNGQYDVFISTVKKGGVGIELNRASYVVFVGQPWVPGEALQAEDRLNRGERKTHVTSYWLNYKGNDVDDTVMAALLSKTEDINAMLGSNWDVTGQRGKQGN